MRGSAIRHLAVCDDSPNIAAAVFESTVQIWCSDDAQQIGEFRTTLDFGGKRLALAADGRICITGSWNAGLAAYLVPTGALLWHRRDLVEIQTLSIDASGRNLYCSFESRPLAVIDVDTGIVTSTINGAEEVFFSRFGDHSLIVERQKYRVQGDHEFEITPQSPCGMQDAAFSPEAVCISEPMTGIRCFDIRSGVQRWHHRGLISIHGCNHLAFNASDYEFYCIATTDAPPHDSSLIRLAPNLLECDTVASIGICSAAAFLRRGRLLITRNGSLYETSSGRVLEQLKFPQQNYPDQ